MSELGVYIPCLNEEYMITPCVRAIQKVLPQVEVIDLGSRDQTLKRLSKLDVVVHHEEEACRATHARRYHYNGVRYVELKNEYSKKHDWVFWVDGDEIWPEDNLRHLISAWEQHKTEPVAIRMAWRDLVVVNNQIYATEPMPNGPKLFNTNHFYFRGNWPRELLQSVDKKASENKLNIDNRFQHQWCWHGRMLNRSSYYSNKHDPVRRAKWQGNVNTHFKQYHPTIEWEQLDQFPWEPAPDELRKLEVPEEYIK
jgi:glycosyltransferase involved in cell wall biosynthesis